MSSPRTRRAPPVTWPDPMPTAALTGLGFALSSILWPPLGRAALAACSLALAAAVMRWSRGPTRRAPNGYLAISGVAAIGGWFACLALGDWPVWPRALLLAASTAAVTLQLRGSGGAR